MRRFFVLAICSAISLQASPASKRISAHLAIKDCHTACIEGREAVAKDSQDVDLWRAYIGALAASGQEKEMMAALKQSGLNDRQILETVAWGVLHKGAASEAPMTKVYALVASFYSQDMRGVNVLYQHLNDASAIHRFVAVQLASDMRDTKLKAGIFKLLQAERNPMVRLQAIEALGKMRYKVAKPFLLQLIDQGVAEEKAAAVAALVLMFDEISEQELLRFVQSDRAPLRILACQLAAHLEQHEELILPLLRDSNSEVRAAAITAASKHVAMTEDLNDRVAIHAAWAMTRHGKGTALFEKLFESKDAKVRVQAAGALAASGPHGARLMGEKLFDEDPFVVMNAALGLIGQRVKTSLATRKLAEALASTSERMMWSEDPAYRTLARSEVTHQTMIPQYPEAVNQATRLEILNVLAIMDAPETAEALKQFLKERAWGISGMASALLLTEGDEAFIAVVEELLEDSDSRLQIQAALVLALWGRSPKAIATLEKNYVSASRDVKEKILEGLGRVGDSSSIPFLVQRLDEPYQMLRVLAAMSLLQCLYH